MQNPLTASTAHSISKIKGLVREVGKGGTKESRLDELVNQLLEIIGDITPQSTQDDARTEIEAAAVTLWNFAVANKTLGSFSLSLNAKVRHAAFKMVHLSNASTNDEATLSKLTMFVNYLKKAIDTAILGCTDGTMHTLQKKKINLEKEMLKIACYKAEAACGHGEHETALAHINSAKEMLPRFPSEGNYITMLCFNFGVDAFKKGEYEHSVSWLRLSFDIGKANNAIQKNQREHSLNRSVCLLASVADNGDVRRSTIDSINAPSACQTAARTLRLLANAFLEWNSKEHWQKALNAIGLANAEHSHPAGLYLKIRILLEGQAPDDRLNAGMFEAFICECEPVLESTDRLKHHSVLLHLCVSIVFVMTAIEEMLRHSELTVDLGINTLRLVSKYKRSDICFDNLEQLAKRFDTSLDLGSIWSTHLELLLNHQMLEAADTAADGYITAHKTNKPMDVASQRQFHLLLWDAAAQAFEKKDHKTALKWYNYSLSLYSCMDEMDTNLAKLHRNRASCYILLAQLEEANAAVELAASCDHTSPHTYFLMYKTALLKGDDARALEALKKMCACEDPAPSTELPTVQINTDQGPTLHGLISLAANLAMEVSNRGVALTALEGLVKRPSSQQQMLIASRCLIRLRLSMLDKPNADKHELQTLFQNINTAYEKLLEIVHEGQPQSVNINDESTWFMKIAWNMALRCGDELDEMHRFYILCYKLNGLCECDMTGLLRQRTCLLMAAAALLQLHKSTPARNEELLQKVVEYCNNCKEIHAKIEDAQITESGKVGFGPMVSWSHLQASPHLSGTMIKHHVTGTAGGDTTTVVLLILYEFEAYARLGTQGLDTLLERAISLPKCDAKTFETMAALAMESPAQLRNLSIRALKVAIKKHLQNPTVDYGKCSKAFHSLVELALGKGTALDPKDEAWGYYMDVIHVIENTAKDRYPEMEILWLMTKAWNCGIYHYSGGKYEEARRWCEMSLRFLKHLSTLQKNYGKHMNDVYSDILAKVDASKPANVNV